MKKIFLYIIIAILSFSTISCGKSETVKDGSEGKAVVEPQSTVASAPIALPVKDPAGNDIVIPKDINRIISMAPSITETIIDLGLGDKIIAIDKNAKGKKGLTEGIIEFDMMAPDIEKMMSLKPDIVLTSGMSDIDGNKEPFKALKEAGVCVAVIPTSNSIEKIKADIMFIADATGTNLKGRGIVENMEAEIDKIAQIGKSISEKKTVYFEIAASPNMYSFGNGVFLNEILEIVGAKNIFADKSSWISVSEEAVVSTNPDVILSNVNYVKDPVSEIKSRKGWESIKAVKNGDVYYVDNSASSLPNENIIKAMQEIAKAIYPDKY